MPWSQTFLDALKANEVKLVTYVPERRFEDGGPVLIAARIDDKPGIGKTVRDPTLIRSRFMKGLGTGRGGALDP